MAFVEGFAICLSDYRNTSIDKKAPRQSFPRGFDYIRNITGILLGTFPSKIATMVSGSNVTIH